MSWLKKLFGKNDSQVVELGRNDVVPTMDATIEEFLAERNDKRVTQNDIEFVRAMENCKPSKAQMSVLNYVLGRARDEIQGILFRVSESGYRSGLRDANDAYAWVPNKEAPTKSGWYFVLFQNGFVDMASVTSCESGSPEVETMATAGVIPWHAMDITHWAGPVSEPRKFV